MGQVWTIENWVYRLRWRMIKREFGDIYPLIRIPKAYGSRFLQVKNENQMVSGGWLAPEANLTPPPPPPPKGPIRLSHFRGPPGVGAAPGPGSVGSHRGKTTLKTVENHIYFEF